jgi:DnaJ-class molecular chaperone
MEPYWECSKCDHVVDNDDGFLAHTLRINRRKRTHEGCGGTYQVIRPSHEEMMKDRCVTCNGSGYDAWKGVKCTTCKGTGKK